MLESERCLSHCIRAIGSVGKIDHLHRHLRRHSEKILGRRAIRLDTPSKLARKSVSDLIDIGADRPAKNVAVTRIIVDTAYDATNRGFVFPTMESRIDCRTVPQVSKIRLGESPTPPLPIDPAKCLILNSLLHPYNLFLQETIVHFSCNTKPLRDQTPLISWAPASGPASLSLGPSHRPGMTEGTRLVSMVGEQQAK